MNTVLNTIAAVAALLVAFMATASADIGSLPEPGSLALTGLGIGLAALFMRKRK